MDFHRGLAYHIGLDPKNIPNDSASHLEECVNAEVFVVHLQRHKAAKGLLAKFIFVAISCAVLCSSFPPRQGAVKQVLFEGLAHALPGSATHTQTVNDISHLYDGYQALLGYVQTIMEEGKAQFPKDETKVVLGESVAVQQISMFLSFLTPPCQGEGAQFSSMCTPDGLVPGNSSITWSEVESTRLGLYGLTIFAEDGFTRDASISIVQSLMADAPTTLNELSCATVDFQFFTRDMADGHMYSTFAELDRQDPSDPSAYVVYSSPMIGQYPLRLWSTFRNSTNFIIQLAAQSVFVVLALRFLAADVHQLTCCAFLRLRGATSTYWHRPWTVFSWLCYSLGLTFVAYSWTSARTSAQAHDALFAGGRQLSPQEVEDLNAQRLASLYFYMMWLCVLLGLALPFQHSDCNQGSRLLAYTVQYVWVPLQNFAVVLFYVIVTFGVLLFAFFSDTASAAYMGGSFLEGLHSSMLMTFGFRDNDHFVELRGAKMGHATMIALITVVFWVVVFALVVFSQNLLLAFVADAYSAALQIEDQQNDASSMCFPERPIPVHLMFLCMCSAEKMFHRLRGASHDEVTAAFVQRAIALLCEVDREMVSGDSSPYHKSATLAKGRDLHGSKTSATKTLRDQVFASYSWISAGMILADHPQSSILHSYYADWVDDNTIYTESLFDIGTPTASKNVLLKDDGSNPTAADLVSVVSTISASCKQLTQLKYFGWVGWRYFGAFSKDPV